MTKRMTWKILAVAVSVLAAWRYGADGERTDIRSSVGTPCRIPGYAHEIECGYLKVDGAVSAGGMVDTELRWYRIPARARYSLQDPVIWIPGFGINTVERGASMAGALKRLLNTRDLIWLEPRGTPPNADEACVPAGAKHLQEQLEPLADADAVKRCLDAWRLRGGSVASPIRQHAQDLERLRDSLNLQKVNILAEGQGSAVALEWSSIAPDAVRRVVLDSPILADNLLEHRAIRMAEALQKAFAACGQAEECRSAYPDPRASLRQVRASLPLTLEIPNPQTGRSESVHLTDAQLASLVMRILHHPVRAVVLPAALQEAAHGDWRPLFGLYALTWPAPHKTFHWETWLAGFCSGTPPGTDMPEDEFAAWFFFAERQRYERLCDAWPVQPEPELRTPEALPPLLVLRGGADPATSMPPAGAEVVLAPGAGHGMLAYGCAADIVYRYVWASDAVGEGGNGPGTACLEQVPYPLPFVEKGR